MPFRRRDLIAAAAIAVAIGTLFALSSPGRLETARAQLDFEVATALLDSGRAEVRDPALGTYLRRVPVSWDGSLGPALFGLPLVASARWASEPEEELERFAFSLAPAAAGGIAAGLILLTLLAHGATRAEAVGTVLAVALSTPFWVRATGDNGESARTLLASLALLALLISRARDSRWLAAGAGLAAGVLALFGWHQALLGIPLAWIVARRKTLLAVYLGALSLSFLLVRLIGNAEGPAGASPWAFPTPATISALFLGPAAGVVWFAPLLIVAALGLPALARHDRAAAIALVGACGLQVVLAAGETAARTEPAWGPLGFAPAIPLIALALPWGATGRTRRLLARGLFALGLLVGLLGLTIDPTISWLERGRSYGSPKSARELLQDVSPIVRIGEIGRAFGRWRDGRPSEFSPAPYPGRLTYAPLPWVAGPAPGELLATFDVWGLPRPWPGWITALDPGRQFLPPVRTAAALFVLGLASCLVATRSLGIRQIDPRSERKD